MGRVHCGRRAGVFECMHTYPYCMLAFMSLLTGFLYYFMLRFNPVKFLMNVLLTSLTSLILDVPPLFMVMLFLIATGCQDPNAARLGSTISRNSAGTDSSMKESSTCKESPLRRKKFSRSWPSWDWLQPYDPELFLRVDKKEKDGSRCGEMDGRVSETRPGDFKIPEANSSLDNSDPPSSLPSQMIKSQLEDQPPLDEYVSVDDVLQVPTSSRGTEALSNLKVDETITTFSDDPLNPAMIQGGDGVGSGCAQEGSASATGEPPDRYLDSIRQRHNNVPEEVSEPSDDGKIDLKCGQGSDYESDIRPRGCITVNLDTEPVIKSRNVEENADEHAVQEALKTLPHHHQLLSVGSLKDWDQYLPGHDEDEILQAPRDSKDPLFEFPTCPPLTVLSSSRSYTRRDEGHFSSAATTTFNELGGTTSTTEPETMENFNDSHEPASQPSMSKISRDFSFHHMTMNEKGEEKLYWDVKYARPAELDSWRKALLSKAKLESALFQSIDGSPRSPLAMSVEGYEPSAPPFNPLLFYQEILAHKEDIPFFKSYEHLIVDEGYFFLFNGDLKPMQYRCRNCDCYTSNFAGLTTDSCGVS